MRAGWRLTALWLAVLPACCGHPDSADLQQLQTFQSAGDRAVASATLACDAADPVCVRLAIEQGAACERLTEVSGEAERAAMRLCAVRAFRHAVALLPAAAADGDRLAATRGLANALKIARDNAPKATGERQQDARELDAVASSLALLPGGAPYAGYYQADATVNHVLAQETVSAQACARLRDASVQLAAATDAADLDTRAAGLRQLIAMQMQQRSCG